MRIIQILVFQEGDAMIEIKMITPDRLRKSPFQMIGKEWMLVTAGNEDKLNTMTASWGGLGVMYGKNVAFTVIRPQRYTREFIDREDAFSLSFLDKKYRKILSYLGTVSGRNEDKVHNSGLTVAYYEGTPYFEEADMVICCRKLYRQTMDYEALLADRLKTTWYPDKDMHILYISEITSIFKLIH